MTSAIYYDVSFFSQGLKVCIQINREVDVLRSRCRLSFELR